MLPKRTFIKIVKYTPLVSLDLIFKNPFDEILLGLRANKPAQNFWFVPGGRLFKDETIEAAFHRITKSELSLDLNYDVAKFLGVFQHIYDDNFSDLTGFGTHYVVLAHEIKLEEEKSLFPGDKQHHMYKWVRIEDLVDDPTVHPNTKFYFLEGNFNSTGWISPKCYPPFLDH